MPHFTQDWFSSKIPLFEKHLSKNIDILEIGAFEGRSALWMLENLSPNRMVIIEPGYMKGENDTLKSNLRGYNYGLIDEPTPLAFQNIIFDKFDFIYIDGNHQSKNCLMDMILSWELVKPNGIMAVDDYRWRRESGDGTYPYQAIDYFLVDRECEILYKDYQVWIRK